MFIRNAVKANRIDQNPVGFSRACEEDLGA